MSESILFSSSEDELWQLKWWLENAPRDLRKRFPIDYFTNRTFLDGLPEDIQTSFLNFIAVSYDLCGEQWKPGNCTSMDLVAKLLYHFILQYGLAPDVEGVVIRRFRTWHYWIEVKMMGMDELLIFDPTGVPLDFSRQFENITPFFGLRNNAQKSAASIYRGGEELDDWGTSAFPRGFIP